MVAKEQPIEPIEILVEEVTRPTQPCSYSLPPLAASRGHSLGCLAVPQERGGPHVVWARSKCPTLVSVYRPRNCVRCHTRIFQGVDISICPRDDRARAPEPKRESKLLWVGLAVARVLDLHRNNYQKVPR